MSLSQASGLIVEAADKLKAEYTKLQLEKAQLEQQRHELDAQQQAYPTTAGGLFGAYTHSPIPVDAPQHNLNEGAWDVPISQLVDLWTVRHGS